MNKTINRYHRAKCKMNGLAIATVCDVSSPEAQAMAAKVEQGVREGWANIREVLNEYHRLFAVERVILGNIIPTVGRQQIAKALTGNIAAVADIQVNKSALGTGTTTPANGDTTLVTETYRKTVASQTYASNIAYNTAFYAAADTNGTFYEHGFFINGTGSANSGILLTRVLLNAPTGITKSAIQTLTIESQITFT